MNNIYIYNNTFKSLLSLINELYINKIKPYNIKPNNYTPTLFDNIINLNIENNKSEKIIKSRINDYIFNIIYTIYLSNNQNKEIIIYYFYINAIKYKNNIINLRNLKCVTEALKINKYVKSECHKFKGFTRFKKIDNDIYYSEINPTNNILPLLSNHFSNRLKNEYWIIKDVNRNLYSIYNKKEFILITGDKYKIDTNYDDKEFIFNDLWKIFYKTIGIKERKNDRCRMNFMPKKYWQYLIEMSDEI